MANLALNGLVSRCSQSLSKEISIPVDTMEARRDELIDKIYQAANTILEESGENLAVRIIAIEEPTLDGVRFSLRDDLRDAEADSYVYTKSCLNRKNFWHGSKKIYTYKA